MWGVLRAVGNTQGPQAALLALHTNLPGDGGANNTTGQLRASNASSGRRQPAAGQGEPGALARILPRNRTNGRYGERNKRRFITGIGSDGSGGIEVP